MTWLVQLRKEKAKGCLSHCLRLSQWGTVEGKALISYLWWPMIGQKEMGMKLHQGKLRLDIRKRLLVRWWSVTGTDSPEKRSWHLACQISSNVCMTLLICFQVVLQGAESRTGCPLWSLPIWDNLLFYYLIYISKHKNVFIICNHTNVCTNVHTCTYTCVCTWSRLPCPFWLLESSNQRSKCRIQACLTHMAPFQAL